MLVAIQRVTGGIPTDAATAVEFDKYRKAVFSSLIAGLVIGLFAPEASGQGPYPGVTSHDFASSFGQNL